MIKPRLGMQVYDPKTGFAGEVIGFKSHRGTGEFISVRVDRPRDIRTFLPSALEELAQGAEPPAALRLTRGEAAWIAGKIGWDWPRGAPADLETELSARFQAFVDGEPQ